MAEKAPRNKEVEGIRIESLYDCFRIHNLMHRGKLFDIDISKRLLDPGFKRTQSRWITHQNERDNWQIPSLDLYHTMFSAFYDNQDSDNQLTRVLIRELKIKFTEDLLRDNLTTSSRVFYEPFKINKVIHDWNTPNELTIEQPFIGKDCDITKDAGVESEIEALLGSRDLEKVEQVYHWMCGRQAHFSRYNQRLDYFADCPASLHISNCDNRKVLIKIGSRDYYQRSARGVRLHHIEDT